MPGMDGFTFIERIRAEPGIANTPAVLVTSRASSADLARGRAAGANAHIAKGEFDQLDFLDTISRLIDERAQAEGAGRRRLAHGAARGSARRC